MAETKFTPGSYWRTRDGRKQFVVGLDELGNLVVIADGRLVKRNPDGTFYNNSGESYHDLIEPWHEPRTVTQWCYRSRHEDSIRCFPVRQSKCDDELFAIVQVTEGEGLDGKVGEA